MIIMKKYKIVIVGGGAGGLSAAIGAYEAGERSILLIERSNRLGGILNQCIHSGFGTVMYNEQLTGPELAQRLINKFFEYKIDYVLETNVLSIDEDKTIHLANAKEGFYEVEAKAIVLTVGCYERSAGAIQLPGDRPVGVYTAGQAQEALNIHGYLVGRRVFILGSGDIGMIMARRMELEGAKVVGVAEILPYTSGLPRNKVQCLDDFSIPLYLSHTVVKVEGKKNLEAVTIAKVDENFTPIPGTEIRFEVDTLLLSIGLIPDTRLLRNLPIELNHGRFPVVDQRFMSSVPGIFIAGNGLHVHDVVDYVSDEGAVAGKSAANYLFERTSRNIEQIAVEPGNLINYVLPNRIALRTKDNIVHLKYRPKKPLENVRIVVRQGENIVRKIFLPFALPAQMEIIEINSEKLVSNEPVIVEVIAHA